MSRRIRRINTITIAIAITIIMIRITITISYSRRNIMIEDT